MHDAELQGLIEDEERDHVPSYTPAELEGDGYDFGDHEVVDTDTSFDDLPVGKQHFAVAVYDCWRSYGGPEEGGWWFTEGELLEVDSWHVLEEDANERCRSLNDGFKDEASFGGHSTATVVALPRREVRDDLRAQLCHFDGELSRDDYVVKWDVPVNYGPPGRPHYC